MKAKRLKYAGVGSICAVAFMCIAVAAEKGAPESAKQLPDCRVKEQRLILSDGSAIQLDHRTYYTAAENFEKGRHPTGDYGVGRIALPCKCNLPNGSVLKPGWYIIDVGFKPGSDTLVFTKTRGIELLQSLYKELSSDIDYRISHADTDGDGTVDDREWSRAFDDCGPLTIEDMGLPLDEALKRPHMRPAYSGVGSAVHPMDDGWGSVIERVSAPLQVKEIDQPRTRSSLEIIPTDKKGTFILEVVFGLYKGTTDLSIISDSM